MVDEDDLTERWFAPPPASWEPGGLQTEWEQELVQAVMDDLMDNAYRLRKLHHAHLLIDANAAHLLAEITVIAVLRCQAGAEVDP